MGYNLTLKQYSSVAAFGAGVLVGIAIGFVGLLLLLAITSEIMHQ